MLTATAGRMALFVNRLSKWVTKRPVPGKLVRRISVNVQHAGRS